MLNQSCAFIFLSVFCSTQTCSPSALVLGASEAGPRSLRRLACATPGQIWQTRSLLALLALGRSVARPPTAIDCSGLPLTLLSFACLFARPQQIGPFGSDVLGSGSLASRSSGRAASDQNPRIRPLGSKPSSSRHLRSPTGLGWWLFGRSSVLPLGLAALSCAPPLVLEARRRSTTASSAGLHLPLLCASHARRSQIFAMHLFIMCMHCFIHVTFTSID